MRKYCGPPVIESDCPTVGLLCFIRGPLSLEITYGIKQKQKLGRSVCTAVKKLVNGNHKGKRGKEKEKKNHNFL